VGLTAHTPTSFKTLFSTCVLDKARLDLANLGRYVEEFEFVKDALKDGLQCNVPEGHVGAAQIFPIFQHPRWRSSTVKHHCTCTDVAACLRACSNNVGPEPEVVKDFSIWFRKTVIPKFLLALDFEELEVNYQKWLKDFPGSYQKKILPATVPENWTNKQFTYEAFAKIEQQFTTVEHEFKDTVGNSVKERQICGPSEEKKLWANPFIKLLEGVAHRHLPSYCGRKNWLEICKTIEDKTAHFSDVVFGAADGSGFDMTQLAWQNKLMNELIMACANHINVHWVEPLNVECLRKALVDSLKLEVFSGNVYYKTQGRASGDGWTTFGNTVLMMSYWDYTFYKAGITDYFLLVKGDDVLFAMERAVLAHFNTVWPKYFAKTKDYQDYGLGQICTKIAFGDITELDFLSNMFFRTSEGRLRMTRIPARVFQTNSWSTKILQFLKHDKYEHFAKQLVYSKGKCLLAWGRGLPIWEVLGNKMVELGVLGKHSEFNEYADGDRVWHNHDDYDAYLLFLEQHYGVTRADVQRIEDSIRSISCLTGDVFIPEIVKFYGDG
jgi:hypothetical protein